MVSAWRDEKARYAELLIGDTLEKKCPGLRQYLKFAEEPRTMERYTLNLTGSIYGWEVTPSQVGRERLGQRTPIKNLYLAGQ